MVFVTKSYFQALKDVRLNTAHFFTMKIPSKTKFPGIGINHSSDIGFEKFKRLCRIFTTNPFSYLSH